MTVSNPTYYLQEFLKRIFGEDIGSFILMKERIDIILETQLIADIDICTTIDLYSGSMHEIICSLERIGVNPCVARKKQLILGINVVYVFAATLSIRAKKLLIDVTTAMPQSRSMRSFERLLDFNESDEESEGDIMQYTGPLERVPAEDPGLYLLDLLIKNGAMTKHLLTEDEPERLAPPEEDHDIHFGTPVYLLEAVDESIEWFPPELGASFDQTPGGNLEDERHPILPGNNVGPQEVVQPEVPALPRQRRTLIRVRQVADVEDVMNRSSQLNHLDYFLKSFLKRRTRERNREFTQTLEKLEKLQRKEAPKSPPPVEKHACPFSTEAVQELCKKINGYLASLPESIHEQPEGQLNRTMVVDNSGRWSFPQTPVLEVADQQMDDLQEPQIGPQNMSQSILDSTHVPNLFDTTHEPTIQPVALDVLPETALAGRESMLEVGPTPIIPSPYQPLLGDPSESAVAEPMDGVEIQQGDIDNERFDTTIQPNADFTVTVVVGDSSIVHSLPLNEEAEPDGQLADNVTRRKRPVRARRPLFPLDSLTSPPPRKRRYRRRKKKTTVAPDVALEVALDEFEALGVMPLPAAEPMQEQHLPSNVLDQNFTETPENIRKRDFIQKLQELQNILGNEINYIQICPFSTMRRDAAFAFKFLLELNRAKEIELIQEAPFIPDKLIIRIVNLETGFE